jgi:glutamate formiminotransferase
VNDKGGGLTTQAAPRIEGVDPTAAPRPAALAVPNCSEGAHEPTIEALEDAVRGAGARLLDLHADSDHNRCVITAAGDPLALEDAMVALAGECLERIDLRRQAGVHPRVGALDVVPIVALVPEDLPIACELALSVANRIADDLALPVFLYGAVATHPERVRPAQFRQNGLDWLDSEVAERRITPDFGPPRLHPSAGCVLVGARPPLIALNVWLPEATAVEARVIAARVREAGGGLPGVRALGFYLPEAGMAQVSMNLEDYTVTGPARAIEAVRFEASRLGVEVGESELVGLIPGAALRGPSPASLRLHAFRPGQVLEAKMPALRRVN